MGTLSSTEHYYFGSQEMRTRDGNLLVSRESSINSIVTPKEHPPIRTQGHSAQMPITDSYYGDHMVSAEAALTRFICKGSQPSSKMGPEIRICFLNVCFAALSPYVRLHASNEMILSYKPCCLHKGCLSVLVPTSKCAYANPLAFVPCVLSISLPGRRHRLIENG